MFKRFITLLAVMAAATTALWAQDPDMAAAEQLPHYQFKLDSTTILLGDQTVLAIQRGPIYPSLEQLTNNDIVAVRQWVDSVDGTLYTALTSFEEGEHWLHVGDDSVLITVNDVPNVDTASLDIKDIADIMRQPYTFGEIAKVVGIVLGILALIAAIVFVVIRLKKHKPIISIPQAPPLPPDTRALNSLEELRQRQLWQQGKAKEYHTELTDIVRRYLEECYQIPSTEMTTDQTLDAFRSCQAFTTDNAAILQQMLQTADMVKFAKSEPLPYQHDRSMTQAVDFVKATAPRPSAPDADAKAAESDAPAASPTPNQPKL